MEILIFPRVYFTPSISVKTTKLIYMYMYVLIFLSFSFHSTFMQHLNYFPWIKILWLSYPILCQNWFNIIVNYKFNVLKLIFCLFMFTYIVFLLSFLHVFSYFCCNFAYVHLLKLYPCHQIFNFCRV